MEKTSLYATLTHCRKHKERQQRWIRNKGIQIEQQRTTIYGMLLFTHTDEKTLVRSNALTAAVCDELFAEKQCSFLLCVKYKEIHKTLHFYLSY